MHTPIIKSTYGHFQFPPQTDSRIKDKLDTDLVDKEYQKMKKKELKQCDYFVGRTNRSGIVKFLGIKGKTK
jgi:hypothetical protein